MRKRKNLKTTRSVSDMEGMSDRELGKTTTNLKKKLNLKMNMIQKKEAVHGSRHTIRSLVLGSLL
jgi:transcription initiation factor TFIIIB Brf1 subunit/transcription initiation factor TFIIB